MMYDGVEFYFRGLGLAMNLAKNQRNPFSVIEGLKEIVLFSPMTGYSNNRKNGSSAIPLVQVIFSMVRISGDMRDRSLKYSEAWRTATRIFFWEASDSFLYNHTGTTSVFHVIICDGDLAECDSSQGLPSKGLHRVLLMHKVA